MQVGRCSMRTSPSMRRPRSTHQPRGTRPPSNSQLPTVRSPRAAGGRRTRGLRATAATVPWRRSCGICHRTAATHCRAGRVRTHAQTAMSSKSRAHRTSTGSTTAFTYNHGAETCVLTGTVGRVRHVDEAKGSVGCPYSSPLSGRGSGDQLTLEIRILAGLSCFTGGDDRARGESSHHGGGHIY